MPSNSTELGEMVVRITGENAQLVKTLADSEKQVVDSAKKVETAVGKIENTSNGAAEALGKVAGAFAAVGVAAVLKQSFDNFAEAELIGIKLNAVLEANGRQVEYLTKDYQAFAAEMERTTTAEDDAVLKLLQTAETMGITGEAAKRAAKNAIGLAAARDVDAQSAIRQTVALEQGREEMLSRYFPALREIKDEGARVAKAQELLAGTFKVAEAAAKSNAGAIAILKRDYGNLLEILGEVVARGVKPAVEWMTALVATMKSLPPWVTTVVAVVGTLAAGLVAIAVVVPLLVAGFKLVAVAAVAFVAQLALMNPAILIIGAIAAAIFLTNRALNDSNMEMAKLNQQFALAATLQGKLAGRFGEQTAKKVAEADAIEDPADKRAFLEEEIKKATKEVEGYQAGVKNAEKVVEELDTTWADLTGNKVLELERNNLKDVTAMLDLAKNRVGQLQEKLNAVAEDKVAKKLGEDIEKATAKIQEQIDNIGLSADEIARKKLFERTTDDGQISDLDAKMAELAQKTKDVKVTKDAEDLTASLKMQGATFGMTADQVAIYKLKMEGATDAQLAAAKAQAKLNAEQKEYADAAKTAFDEGKSVTEIVMTPLEKQAAEIERLNALRQVGAITEETYGRAVLRSAAAINQTTAAMQDAAQAGSAEAMRRADAYRLSRQQAANDKQAITSARSIATSTTTKDPAQLAVLNKIALGIDKLKDQPKTVLEIAGLQ